MVRKVKKSTEANVADVIRREVATTSVTAAASGPPRSR